MKTGESEYDFINEMTLKEFDELFSNVLKKYPAR